jgi:chromosome segregation ATPase
VGDLEAQIDVANEELMTLTEANEGLQQRLEAEKLLYTKELDELRSALQAEKAAREAEASAHQETKQVLSEAQAESERRATELRAQKTELEARCAALTATESELRQNKAALEATVAARELDLETLAARGRAAEELRREMHETISELKGNIRVYCRVRPLLRREVTLPSSTRTHGSCSRTSALARVGARARRRMMGRPNSQRTRSRVRCEHTREREVPRYMPSSRPRSPCG